MSWRVRDEHRGRLVAVETIEGYVVETIEGYVNHGWPMGDFLTAVFANDFVQAACRADCVNKHLLLVYAQIVYSAPLGCWGDQQKVERWQDDGGLEGLTNG